MENNYFDIENEYDPENHTDDYNLYFSILQSAFTKIYLPKSETNKCIIDDDEKYIALKNDGLKFYHCGQFVESANYFTIIVNKYENIPEIWDLLGIIYLEYGDRDLAIECIENAINLNSYCYESELYLSQLEFCENEFDDLALEINEALDFEREIPICLKNDRPKLILNYRDD